MTDNPRAQKVGRIGMNLFWQVVGQGMKSQEEVDAVSLYLFNDEAGLADVEMIDEKMGRLPGLEGIRLMTQGAGRRAPAELSGSRVGLPADRERGLGQEV